MGKGGVPLPRKVVNRFVHYYNDSKRLFNRRNIYTFFKTFVGLYPWTPIGDGNPRLPNLPTPGKNPAGAHDVNSTDKILGETS